MKFREIPQLTRGANYRVNQSWKRLREELEHYQERYPNLDLDPEFQRGHVWAVDQQVSYVEFKLKGGYGSSDIQFNCIGWMGTFVGPFVLVDGKQRLTAVLKFLSNELPAFGTYYSEFEDKLPYNIDFIFCINDLKSMDEVYRWYLELNSGGTPHTEEELDKVRKMIK